jgi:hypothetical protein
VPWGAINHRTDPGINNAVHRFGTPAAWPIRQPSGQRPRLTLVEAVAPAEDRARRDAQAWGHRVHRVAFMEPEQRLGSMHLSSVMGGMSHRHQVLIVCRRETQRHRFFSVVWL